MISVGRVFALCTIAALGAIAPAYAASALDQEPFITRVALSDAVFEGTIVTSDTTTWIPTQQCPSVSSPIEALDIIIAPTQVVSGVIAGSQVRVRATRSAAALRDLKPGRHILFWGYRECGDNWNLWGRVLVANDEGIIVRAGTQSATQTLEALIARLNEKADINPTAPFRQFEQLSSMVVVSAESKSSLMQVVCSPLEGDPSANASMVLLFRKHSEAISRLPSPGDTLVVPVYDASADTLTYGVPPTAFVVRDGYIRGLGITYQARATAFEALGTHFSIKHSRPDSLGRLPRAE